MSEPRLDVLLVDDEGPVAATAAAALRRRGHVVRTAHDAGGALAQALPDVLVCSTELADGTGLELVAELRRRGSGARTVLLGGLDGQAELRSALRLGVAELLERPCRLAELVEAVEGGPRPALPAGGDDALRTRLRRAVRAEACEIDVALRELVAFLVRHGVSPTTRMRAASACAEVLDNVQRHAWPDDEAGQAGHAELVAEIDARELVVRIGDRGAGFDPLDAARLEPEGEPARGLARAAALAEDLRLESEPGQGTLVTLRFTAYRVEFEEQDAIDLSELDWLPPALAQRVLAGLSGGGEPVYNLSPALAVTVGRLLAGTSVRQRAERALWS